ncbi:MAG TPA: hypothetical protein DIW81_08555 [Planctomycetaceae bacterium]|nr:hypothetical protein [Rubinisphaera sp.]HCS51627.1 hypothetical protein [Planctomycetaceae bacterium]
MVIDVPDAIPGGPAWLLQQSGWMVDSWDGSVKLLDKARSAPATARPAAPCKTWQNVTGDAGWAGVLAETFLADPNRKVFLIYQPGVDILALFEEAIALLPASRRWDVTFSTYGAALPATVDCLWSGVISGTQEEHLSKRFVNAMRIDLTKAIGTAPDTGKLVSVARTGNVPTTATISPPAERPVTTASGISMTSDDVVADRHNLMPQAHTTPGNITKNPPPVPRAVKKESSGNGRLILIVLACVIFFGGGTVASIVYVLKKPVSTSIVDTTNATNNSTSDNGSIISANTEPSELLEDKQKSGDIEIAMESDFNGSLKEDNKDGIADTKVSSKNTSSAEEKKQVKNDIKKRISENKNKSPESITVTREDYFYPQASVDFRQHNNVNIVINGKWHKNITPGDKVTLLFPLLNDLDPNSYFSYESNSTDKHINILISQKISGGILIRSVEFSILIDGNNSSFNVNVVGSQEEQQRALLAGCGVNFKSSTSDVTIAMHSPVRVDSLKMNSSSINKQKTNVFAANIPHNEQLEMFFNKFMISNLDLSEDVNLSGDNIDIIFKKRNSDEYVSGNIKLLNGIMKPMFNCKHESSHFEVQVIQPEFSDLQRSIKDLNDDCEILVFEIKEKSKNIPTLKNKIKESYPEDYKVIKFNDIENCNYHTSSDEDYEKLMSDINKVKEIINMEMSKPANKDEKRPEYVDEFLDKRIELWNKKSLLEDKQGLIQSLKISRCTLFYNLISLPGENSLVKKCELMIIGKAKN